MKNILLIILFLTDIGYCYYLKETTNLPYSSDISCIVENGYFYIVDNTGVNQIQYSKIKQDGSLGAFNSTIVLPENLSYNSTVSNNGYIYVTGGTEYAPWLVTGTERLKNTIYYSKINSDGSMIDFSTNSEIPSGRCLHSSVIYNNYFYVTGGFLKVETPTQPNHIDTDLIYYSKINFDGLMNSQYDWFAFKLCDMWDKDNYRIDGYWSPIQTRLFRFRNAPFGLSGTLHCGNVPFFISRNPNGFCYSDMKNILNKKEILNSLLPKKYKGKQN